MRLRAQRRLPTRFPTAVHADGERLDVVVIDITESGAKIDGLGGLTPSASCELNVLSDTIPCTVRWTAGSSAGVTFGRKLTPHQLDVIRHRRTPRKDQGPKPRAGHGFRELR